MSTVYFAADHAGFPLKEALLQYCQANGIPTQDLGTYGADQPVDYPKNGEQVAQALQTDPSAKGVILCGSGVGVAIAANRFPWVRAVHAHDVFLAQMSRRHNDSNVLCMGARFVAPQLGTEIFAQWLATDFEGERHQARIDQLSQLQPAAGVC